MTADDQATFQGVKEAYEVLANPKRRQLYDGLGADGLKWVEDPSSVDQQKMQEKFMHAPNSTRCNVLLGVLVLIGFLLTWPILVAYNIDQHMRDVDDPNPFAWTAVWTPLWIIEGFMFLQILLYVAEGHREKTTKAAAEAAAAAASPSDGGASPAADDVESGVPLRDHGGAPAAPDGGGADATAEDEPGDDEEEGPEGAPLWARWLLLVKWLVLIVFQLLLTLRLDEAITTPWPAVLAPWMLWELLELAEAVRGVRAPLVEPPSPPDDASESDRMAYDHERMKYEVERMSQAADARAVAFGSARLLFVVLLAVRLGASQPASVPWPVVWLPIWGWLFAKLVLGALLCVKAKKLAKEIPPTAYQDPELLTPSERIKAEAAATTHFDAVRAINVSWMLGLVFVLACVRVVQDDAGRFSAFLIFIPVFALAFFVFCFLCCVVCLSRDYEEDEGTLVLSHEQFQQGGTLALSREQVEQTLVRTGDMSEYNGHPTAEQLQRLIAVHVPSARGGGAGGMPQALAQPQPDGGVLLVVLDAATQAAVAAAAHSAVDPADEGRPPWPLSGAGAAGGGGGGGDAPGSSEIASDLAAVKLMLDEEPLAPDGNEAKGAGAPPPASPAAPAAKQPDLLSPDVAVEGLERVAAAPSAADEDDAGDGTWTHVDDDID